MPGITNPAEPYFKDGQWGWDGTVWRKLPMVWGFSERWAEHAQNLDAALGTNTLSMAAVDPGYVHVLDCFISMNLNSICHHAHQLEGGGVNVQYKYILNVAAATRLLTFPVGMCLAEGDVAKCVFLSCTALDDLHIYAWGYKMKIAE